MQSKREKRVKALVRKLYYPRYLAWKFPGHDRDILHFIHIGKTGGSAIKHALSGDLVTDKYQIVIHNHFVKARHLPKGSDFFFVVRDPASRFVSGFYSRLRNSKTWSKDETDCFKTFKTPNELAESITSKDKRFRKAAIRAMNSVQHISDDMCDYVQDYDLTRCHAVWVGRQEFLGTDFEELKRTIGLPAEISLPQDQRTAHRTPRGFDKKLSYLAIENLRSWYQKDFVFFYRFQNWQG
jgi:hypothetical protein